VDVHIELRMIQILLEHRSFFVMAHYYLQALHLAISSIGIFANIELGLFAAGFGR